MTSIKLMTKGGLVILSSLYLAWQLTAVFNYSYSYWYQFFAIDQHIAYYGPQNKFKPGFATTSLEQRQTLFTKIVAAVHQQGRGLADIYYQTADGQSFQLLRKPEIVHLQDVARLIDWANYLGVTSLLLLVLWQCWLWFRVKYQQLPVAAPVTMSLPKIMWQVVIVVLISSLLTLTIYLLGATKVFYQLHDWLFPTDHQWFFYYQESLMSTLMKAPDLFAGIAAQIAVLAVVIMLAMILVNKYFRVKLVQLNDN